MENKPDNCKICRDKFKEDEKTIPCKGFAKGLCRFGKKCRFLHAGDDVVVVEELDDAAVAQECFPDALDVAAEMDDVNEMMVAAGIFFGNKEFNPFKMDAAAVAEIEELAEYAEELMADDDY